MNNRHEADPVEWMDSTERSLIIKFFGVDPVQVVDPTVSPYVLGESMFHRIVEFYHYEYKVHEQQFWDVLLPAIEPLPDIPMVLEMSKVDVGYVWLDYVTDVDIKYRVVYNELLIDIQQTTDVYLQPLILICNMMFVSDFNDVASHYADVDTDKAWKRVIQYAEQYRQQPLL